MSSHKVGFFRFIMLWPLSLIYKFVGDLRNFLYENGFLKSKEYDLPVISVGNISVGGTGKTPHVEYVLRMLSGDFKTAVLSRGYKRKTKGFRIVEPDDDYTLCGDEPLQVKRKFRDVVVAVCEKRTKGVEQLRELYPDLNLIILDDAFQHRRINPGLHILLINYNYPISSDYVLPLGRLRESRSNVHRAHLLVYTNCSPKLTPMDRRILTKEVGVLPYQHLSFTMVVYENPLPVFGGSKNMSYEKLSGYNVLAVTGIAHPENFVEMLTTKAKSVMHIPFSDHHDFSAADILKVRKAFDTLDKPRAIVVTEKDAMRLRTSKFLDNELMSCLYYIPIRIELLCDEEEKKQFNNQIISYVRNNKRYNKLYQSSL
ncbi:MAG: tetraacyldisaccharide 4'-kinase [Bacteroidales bacterium]|nr:tetraacyldisaccharide 4'-kinase [Bacteroidales bacterium]